MTEDDIKLRQSKWECKVCKSEMVAEIEGMILNGANYTAIITRHKQLYPKETPLSSANISNHKRKHLLTRPIVKVVENEDGSIEEQRTYLTGHYPASAPIIPKENIPEIPQLADSLRIIIGVGLHNILTNPEIVSPVQTIEALKLYSKLFGREGDERDELLGSWGDVKAAKDTAHKKAKRTRTVTVSEEIEETTVTESKPNEKWADAIDAEWAALPEPTKEDNECA